MNAHATPHASGTVFLDVFVEHASALPARVHKHLRMVRELDECAAGACVRARVWLCVAV